MPARPKVLVVEDDQDLLRAIVASLEDRFHVRAASTVGQARSLLIGASLVVVDVKLPDGTALDVIRAAEAAPKFPRIIAMSGAASAAEAFELSQAGAIVFLPKPFDLEALDRAIDRVLAGGVPLDPLVLHRMGQSSLTALVDEVREIMVRRALSKAGDSKRGAAKLLGITRQGLQQILKRAKVDVTVDDE